MLRAGSEPVWLRVRLHEHTHQERTYISFPSSNFLSFWKSQPKLPAILIFSGSRLHATILSTKFNNNNTGSCRFAANDCLPVCHQPGFLIVLSSTCMIYLRMENAVIISSFKTLIPPVCHKEMHMCSHAHMKRKNKNYAELSILDICVPTRNMVLLCLQWT